MKKYTDKGKGPFEFEEGEKVLLKPTPQIWKKSKIINFKEA